MPSNNRVDTLAKDIQGIIFDVDGVLTDGRIIYSDDGHELKAFHVQDGSSIKLLAEHGVTIGIISGRRSPMVAKRARELGIQFIAQGVSSKSEALDRFIVEGFPETHIAVVGDDLQDIELFQHPSVALIITVANGHPAVLQRAHLVTQRKGGDGVAAEIAQTILTAQRRWPF